MTWINTSAANDFRMASNVTQVIRVFMIYFYARINCVIYFILFEFFVIATYKLNFLPPVSFDRLLLDSVYTAANPIYFEP